MARWEPNARDRLARAAMELFDDRGFDETAVADIAARADLTERTFFRYFADKREVLFGGAAELEELLAKQLAGAPATARPLDAVAAAFEATSPFFEERRAFAKQRQRIIAAHPALKERELIKMASLGALIAGALRGRGVPEPAASLAAEAGIAVFKLAFERWLEDARKRDLAHHVREALGELKAVATGDGRARPSAGPKKKRYRTS
jgi:AcrR family transcriptional regulator